MTMTTGAAERIRPSDFDWRTFPDPHGRPTTPVRFLKGEEVFIIEADFPPEFYAGDHWHPADTVYLFYDGDMRIGEEGRFRPGDVRWVRAGHVYGPEHAGAEGVKFYLISLGAEFGLHWADLYEAPAPAAKRLQGFATPHGRATFSDEGWSDAPGSALSGVESQIISSTPPHIARLRLAPGSKLPAHRLASQAVWFVRSGALESEAEGGYEASDFRFSKAQSASGDLRAGPDGADLVVITGETPFAPDWSPL